MLWLTFLKAFAVGGAICLIGQIIINWTHLTNGKILVIFLLAGAVLQGFGVYEYLIKWAGAGASVPISGFGYALVKGAVDSHHRHRGHRVLHDDAGHQRRPQFRLGKDGLHLPGRYARHELHHYYI